MPRDTLYSGSARLRFLDISFEAFVVSEAGTLGGSSSSSEAGSAMMFASSVARIISYTPLLNSSAMCNLD